jgi:hypothetical protein
LRIKKKVLSEQVTTDYREYLNKNRRLRVAGSSSTLP